MLLPAPPLIVRKPRKRMVIPKKARLPLGGPVTLVSASFSDDDDGAVVTLVFDQPVSVAGFVAAELILQNQVTQSSYVAVSALLVDPVTVKVDLTFVEEAPAGPDVIMNAGPGNGILAVADAGNAWVGAANLELPFP